MTDSPRQYVRFLFLKLDAAWRRLEPDEQARHKAQFATTLLSFRGRLLLRSYSLSGTRGDADLLLWQVSDDVEAFQEVQTAMFSTDLAGYLSISHSYIGMTRRSIYQFPDRSDDADMITVRPQDSRYLFVYPFVKKRSWYALPREERQAMMQEHATIGRAHPDVRLNTIYSYGLDDQEFVLAFESDDPGDFLDLVMELRETKSSSYTELDVPIFTCLQMSLWEALDAMGGRSTSTTTADTGDDTFTDVAGVEDLSPNSGLRVYCGREVVALFKIGERVFAVADRCTHGRASLSEGSILEDGCTLQCPWHEGRFDLESGRPCGGPVRVPIKTFEVKIESGRVLVRA